MRYLADVVSLQYDPAKCTGCRRCTEVCPQGVYVMHEKKAAVAERDLCIECGACAANCAYGAIKVNAGVGCAAAMIYGILKYGDPDKGACGPGSDGSCCCEG